MMKPNTIVLDLETKRTFEDVGGFRNLGGLGVSLVGVYSYRHKEYISFWEKDFPKLYTLLAEKPLVVGFNQRRFDLPVLQPHFKEMDLLALPMVDILEDMQKALGHRVKLDSVAEATLGTRKSGHGLDAIRFWQEGDLEKLEKYCLDDVRITKEIYEYGASRGEILFMDKFGVNKKKVTVAWKLEREETDDDRQIRLF